ncbi:MAG: histidine kinase dimerization/phosphoacceptor domain -containing protein [Emticicia sp.]|uniref:histidine kinase dimerization/phosphoacceptor domain -containing protein n=1 Tax=Emticicia sp. TaxID=1930953 RepID=UPI003BA7B409
MKKIFTLFLLFYISTENFAQTKVDSLKQVLAKTKIDTVRLNILSDIIKQSLYSDPTEARKFAQQYLSVAQKNKITKEIARGTNLIGMTYHVSGEINKALGYYIEALKGYELLKDSLYMGISMNNIAACYQFRKEPKETIEYYEKALNIFQKINNKQWIANVSYNLGNQYTNLRNFNKALNISRLALKSFRDLSDKNSEGLAYTQLGSIDMELNKLAEAITYFQQSNQLINIEDDPIAVGINYENLGAVYGKIGQYKDGESNLLKAIDIFRKHQSLEHLTKSLAAIKTLYAKWGKFQEAFLYGEEFQKANDSLFNSTKDERMLETIKKYDLEKKEQQISLLNSQNELKDFKIKKSEEEAVFYGLGILGLIILVGIGFYLYQVKKKTSEELSQKNAIITEALHEKEVLMQEIHHRVKNNLQVVSSLLSIQSRHLTDNQAIEAIKEGQNRVKTMGLIHQSLYQENDFRGVNMKNYISKLIKNLFNSYNIQPEKIQLKTEISELNLDIDTVVPLGLIINELVSNALKYAFPDDKKGTILLRANLENERFILQVSDNGIGFPEGFSLEKTNSMGYQLIQSFVSKLSAQLTVRSENGTFIELSIPQKSIQKT